ncbi:MAG: glycoside hydrolase family 38 C-terminal domain-containing protein, partial [Planctomycetota bacterium]
WGGVLVPPTNPPPPPAPLNQLTLSVDHAAESEARRLDREVDATAAFLSDPAESIRVRENGPLRARIEVSRSLGKHSRIVQTYTLAAGSPRLDVETLVDWHEERRLLRATFPLDVTSPRATCDLPFGVVERPAHEGQGSQPDSAEDCVQRFVVVSEAGFGVALLNDSKYGHSWRDGALRLSLLRSPVGADPAVDRGEHRFTYSLMPFAGDWRTAGVLHETEKLNAPLQLLRAPAGSSPSPTAERTWAPFEVEVPAGSSSTPVIDAFKGAEEGGVCLRLHEHGGGRGEVIVHWRLDVEAVETVNLMEEPRSCDGFVHVGRMTRLTLAPFEISTLRVRLRR